MIQTIRYGKTEKEIRLVSSKLTPYELHRASCDDRIDENDSRNGICNPKDRYHIVDCNGRMLASAKSVDMAIINANRVISWNVCAVIDQKYLVAYAPVYATYGAGHTYIGYFRRFASKV